MFRRRERVKTFATKLSASEGERWAVLEKAWTNPTTRVNPKIKPTDMALWHRYEEEVMLSGKETDMNARVMMAEIESGGPKVSG